MQSNLDVWRCREMMLQFMSLNIWKWNFFFCEGPQWVSPLTSYYCMEGGNLGCRRAHAILKIFTEHKGTQKRNRKTLENRVFKTSDNSKWNNMYSLHPRKKKNFENAVAEDIPKLVENNISQIWELQNSNQKLDMIREEFSSIITGNKIWNYNPRKLRR